MAIDDIRARLEACPIPEDARSDWDGTNHYEIQTPYGDTWTWLDVGDVFGAKPDDYSDTEEGQLLGAVLDYATHYARDVAALLRANEALAKALREAQGCIVKHHNISSKRELGRLCPICVPADGSSDIFQIIDAALAGAETGAEK